MPYPLAKKPFFLSVLFCAIVLSSCQKEIDFIDLTDPVVKELIDSTQLVKSIKLVDSDLYTQLPTDSVTESYYYDTANKRITISWEGDGAAFIPGSSAQVRYNSKNLVSGITYTYPSGYTPTEWDYSNIDISYDTDSILQKIVVRYATGVIQTYAYHKTMLSNGSYQLDWDENYAQPTGIVRRRAKFDKNGNNYINRIDDSFIVDYNGIDDEYNNRITTDSMMYDANGNVSKIFRNEVDTLRHTNINSLPYDITSRLNVGDQLYKQRRLIMRGISNMPFGDSDEWTAGSFGITSLFLSPFEAIEYSRFPMQSVQVYNYNTDLYEPFQSNIVIDNKNRLTYFKGFFHDGGFAPIEYRIAYYK